MVLYMYSCFWLLGVESRDFSQAEKERTAFQAVQIHKLTTIFTQIGHSVVSNEKSCNFAHLCKEFFLSQHEKYHVTPKLCNQVRSLSLFRWRTLTLLKI